MRVQAWHLCQMLLINVSMFLAATRHPVFHTGQSPVSWCTHTEVMCMRVCVGIGGCCSNPTHYNSNLWLVKGAVLLGITTATYQYVLSLRTRLCKAARCTVWMRVCASYRRVQLQLQPMAVRRMTQAIECKFRVSLLAVVQCVFVI